MRLYDGGDLYYDDIDITDFDNKTDITVTKGEMELNTIPKGVGEISANLHYVPEEIGEQGNLIFAADFPKMTEFTMQNPLVILPLIIGIGVFTCVLPYFLYTLSLKALPAGTASAMGMIDPMAATVYSVLFFKEPLTAASICGIILIIGSAIVLGCGDGEKK